MNSKKKIINSRNIIILIVIVITLCIMFVKKFDFIENINDSLNFRDLSLNKIKDYSCDKADSRLLDKFLGDFTEETGKPKENLNDAQLAIVNFSKNSRYSNLKPYFKRIAIYIVFLCLVIIFIALWISYCSCCYCNRYLFSPIKEASKLSFIFYIISAIFNLLVIIFSIIILCLTNPFFRRVNGLFCSTLTLLEHLINGFGTQYPSHTSEWNGLNHVIDRFAYSDELLKTVDDEYINSTFYIAHENCEKETSCMCNTTELEIDKYLWDIYFFINYAALDLPTQIGKMKGGLTILDETKVDVGDDIYDFLHDYANKHIKNVCLAIFVLTLIIGVLGLIFLSLYYFLKNEIYRFVYIVIWNLSMLFMILAILVSVLFGVLGYVTRDGVQIIHYTLSSYNLLSDDPIFFKSKNFFISSMIEECANEEGDFLDSLGDDILSSKNESDADFNEIMHELNNIHVVLILLNL